MATRIYIAGMLGLIAIGGCGAPARLVAAARPQLASVATPPAMPSGPTATVAGPAQQTVIVPDLVGKTPDQARLIVRAAGFTAEIEPYAGLQCPDAPREPGRINCQDPVPGKVEYPYAMIRYTAYAPHAQGDQLMREQIEALHGMTPDEARQRLKQLGHDGQVTLRPVVQFSASCGQNKVCGTNRDAGMGIHDDIDLLLNPRLQISTPP